MVLGFRITALGNHLLHLRRLGASISQRNFIATTNPVHPDTPSPIAVAEIKRRTTAGPDLEHQTFGLPIKVINQKL
jgi:hypothetical protein